MTAETARLGGVEHTKPPRMCLDVLAQHLVSMAAGDGYSVDDVMDILSVPVIGTVPDDEDIVISTNQGEPLVGMNGYAGQAYLNICKRILGESVPFIQLDASPGFWSRISGFLKRA